MATKRPSTDRARRQREHELAVARRFHAFLRARGQRLGRPSAGDPERREPDALCLGPAGIIGIEVTCPYYDRRHAAATWSPSGPTTGSASGKGTSSRDGRRSLGPDAALLDELLLLLDKKLQKTYRVPTYLVLDASHADLTSSREAGLFVPALAYRPPAGSPIVGIYLGLGRPMSMATDFFEVPAL